MARDEVRNDAHPPIEPLDVTGARTVLVGTIAWAVAFVVLLPFYGRLDDNGDLWWLWTCATGFALGVLGWIYCRRREQRLRREQRPGSQPADQAADSADQRTISE